MGVAVSCEATQDPAGAQQPVESLHQKEKDRKDAGETDGPDTGSNSEEGGGVAESSEEEGDDSEEEEEPEPVVEVASVPYDPRFPTTNQARHCYTRYNEYFKCKSQKGEDDDACKFFQKAYRSICPGEWVEKWTEQREAGTWAGKY